MQAVTEAQYRAVVILAQQQERQIRQLVNLLLKVLDDEPNSKVVATEYIFVQTKLYEYIDMGETKK